MKRRNLCPGMAGLTILLGSMWPCAVFGQAGGSPQAALARMVQRAVIDGGVRDRRVIDAMRKTPRAEFLPASERRLAYEDMALPIGHQQTISSPFIVAFMTEALAPRATDRVLEIGTGSGYQAAVLSHVVKDVYTIEIIEPLARRARDTLKQLGYRNVHTRIGDGFQGWPEHAPFDKIIVTCSPEKVPQPLIDQLCDGGLLVIPVGQRYQQILYVMRKRGRQLEREALRPTLFVPMTGSAEDARRVQADPLHPAVVNSGFEKPALASGFVPDWYYQRQATHQSGRDAPEGEHYLEFQNTEPGKPSYALQGFAIDGSQIKRLRISGWVRCQSVRSGRSREELPAIVVSFYDKDRSPVGNRWLGPFQGTSGWQQQSTSIPVPANAMEAILRIGLFGGVGKVAFDDVQVQRADP